MSSPLQPGSSTSCGRSAGTISGLGSSAGSRTCYPSGQTAAARPRWALERLEGYALGRNVRIVFRSWVVVFALVGAQMSWVLRPFIGDPSQPFQWFRPRQSHFFEAVWSTFRNLFS